MVGRVGDEDSGEPGVERHGGVPLDVVGVGVRGALDGLHVGPGIAATGVRGVQVSSAVKKRFAEQVASISQATVPQPWEGRCWNSPQLS